jgi:2-methylcitrate dehydratase PrpD
VITKLSRYMAESKGRMLPGDVVEKAKHHILDTLGAMISGAELPPGRAAIRFATSYGGEKFATVAASKVLYGPIEAALANGVLAHSDETGVYARAIFSAARTRSSRNGTRRMRTPVAS